MRRFTKTLATMGTLAVSLFLWSCDNLGEPTQPSGLTPSGYAVFSNSAGQRFVVVKEQDPSGSVSATIGSSGGKLMLGKHVLDVPANAVDGPTLFRMSHVDAELLRVRLSATREAHNDVGAAGFAVPLKLSLSYENAADLPDDVGDLVVVYFQADGTIKEQVSTVETQGHRAIGQIPHFSDFGLAWPL